MRWKVSNGNPSFFSHFLVCTPESNGASSPAKVWPLDWAPKLVSKRRIHQDYVMAFIQDPVLANLTIAVRHNIHVGACWCCMGDRRPTPFQNSDARFIPKIGLIAENMQLLFGDTYPANTMQPDKSLHLRGDPDCND